MRSAANANNYKSRSAELRRVAHSLNDRALGVNGVTPTEAVLTNRNHLTTLKEDRNMVARHVLCRIAPLLREDIEIDMLLDPSREEMGGVNPRIECCHPVSSLQRDVLHHGHRA